MTRKSFSVWPYSIFVSFALPGGFLFAALNTQTVGAAVGWPIRLDREAEFCARLDRRRGTCHTALIILGLVMAWISVIVGTYIIINRNPHHVLLLSDDGSYIYIYISAVHAAVCANHGRKKRRPSPLQLVSSRPAISLPVIVHAGQFADGEDDRKFGGFMDIPLEHQGAGEAEEP
jgi:hypothetical protein